MTFQETQLWKAKRVGSYREILNVGRICFAKYGKDMNTFKRERCQDRGQKKKKEVIEK